MIGAMPETEPTKIPSDKTSWRIALVTAFSGLMTSILPECLDSEGWKNSVPYISPLLALLIAEGVIKVYEATFTQDPAVAKLQRNIKKAMRRIRKQLKDELVNSSTREELEKKYNAYVLALTDLQAGTPGISAFDEETTN